MGWEAEFLIALLYGFSCQARYHALQEIKSSKIIIKYPSIINIIHKSGVQNISNILCFIIYSASLYKLRGHIHNQTPEPTLLLCRISCDQINITKWYTNVWCIMWNNQLPWRVEQWYNSKFPNVASDWLAAQPQPIRNHIRKSFSANMDNRNSETLGKQRTSNILDPSYMKKLTFLVCYTELSNVCFVRSFLNATV